MDVNARITTALHVQYFYHEYLDTLTPYYHIYPKYSDTSTPYHTWSKIWTSTIYYPVLCLKLAEGVANSVDPDEMPHFVASHLGLHCLLMPVCPNTYGKYRRYVLKFELYFNTCWCVQKLLDEWHSRPSSDNINLDALTCLSLYLVQIWYFYTGELNGMKSKYTEIMQPKKGRKSVFQIWMTHWFYPDSKR